MILLFSVINSYLRNMFSDYNRQADKLLERLQYFADGETKVAMLPEFMKFSLDTLAKVLIIIKYTMYTQLQKETHHLLLFTVVQSF